MRVETIGDATLYLGDCMEILPRLHYCPTCAGTGGANSDGGVCRDCAGVGSQDRIADAVITDPPYGIGEARADNKSRSRRAQSKDYGVSDWDDAPPSADLIDLIRSFSDWQAFFGGNYFNLPPSSCWLVWDKLNGNNDFADCELVWTNWPKAVRRIQWRWHGLIREGQEERFHPTQKPLQVMGWVIDLCPKADSILDPFMGSGTTGVAAVERRRQFIGIEREQSYFDIACRRIEQAYKQRPLFEAEPVKQPEQLGLVA